MSVQVDVSINATVEVSDDEWEGLLDAADGDEEEALYELVSDLDGISLDSMYGSAWVCSADSNGVI